MNSNSEDFASAECPHCHEGLELAADTRELSCPYCGRQLINRRGLLVDSGDCQAPTLSAPGLDGGSPPSSSVFSTKTKIDNKTIVAGLVITVLAILLLVGGPISTWLRAIVGFALACAAAYGAYKVVEEIAAIAIIVLLVSVTVIAWDDHLSTTEFFLRCLVGGVTVGIVTIPLWPYIRSTK